MAFRRQRQEVPDVLAGASERDDSEEARRARLADLSARVAEAGKRPASSPADGAVLADSDIADAASVWVYSSIEPVVTPTSFESPVWLTSRQGRSLDDRATAALGGGAAWLPAGLGTDQGWMAATLGELTLLAPELVVQIPLDKVRGISFPRRYLGAVMEARFEGVQCSMSFFPSNAVEAAAETDLTAGLDVVSEVAGRAVAGVRAGWDARRGRATGKRWESIFRLVPSAFEAG